jgi:hypothetical protein
LTSEDSTVTPSLALEGVGLVKISDRRGDKAYLNILDSDFGGAKRNENINKVYIFGNNYNDEF